jgi:hypothetical protein
VQRWPYYNHYNKQSTDARKAFLERALTLSPFSFLSLEHRLLYAGDIDAFPPLSRLLLLQSDALRNNEFYVALLGFFTTFPSLHF